MNALRGATAKEIINVAIRAVGIKELEERISQLEELLEQNIQKQKRY